MDHHPSSNFNMTTTHAQTPSSDLAFNSFIDDVNAYAEDPVPTNNDDFMSGMTSWNPNLFDTADQSSTSQQQQQQHLLQPQKVAPVSSQIYGQNISRQSNSPGHPQYGTAQPSFAAQYSQPSFDPRQLTQSPYNGQFMTQISPSPGPYSTAYSLQPMNYPSQDQTLHSAPTFNSHPGGLPQRPQSGLSQNFVQQPSNGPSQYFTYASQGLQYPPVQNRDIQSMASFTEQNQQPTNHFVNPSMLTAGDMSNMMNARNNDYTYQARQQYTNSPYLSNLSLMDGRMQQTFQTAVSAETLKPSSAQIGVPLAPNPPKITKPKAPKDPNAPKRPRGRPRKDGTMPRSKKDGQLSASTSESESSEELEIEEEPPDPPPALLVVEPPSDLGSKALYDAVKAVWSPKNKPAVGDDIRSGIKLFGEAVKSLRDAWKVKNESLRKAELPNGGNPEVAADLKAAVARLRQNMEKLMQRSLTHGHPAHLMSLGENPHTMSALYSFLLDRFTATDYDGSLVLSILQLIVKFTTMDSAMLEMTKNVKILEKLTKKANKEVKLLAQTILDNAAAATAKKKAADQTGASDNPASPRPSNDAAPTAQNTNGAGALPRKDTVVGLKRPREDSASLPAKRPVTKPIPQASKPLAVQAAERKRAEMALAAQAAKTEKALANGSTASTPPKTKVPVVVPKPANNMFSSLQSASKKPGTSNAARAAAATKEKVVTVPRKESPPLAATGPAKPTFSFMDTLADINKPKEVEQKKVEDLPPETEEERSKRLRKEQRRKLRVSWKPDNSLVETRIFTHDPDEEIGHAESMVRDVGDIGGEGRTLKAHMDQSALEDEDEDGEELDDYTSPSEVDFSEVDGAAENFMKAGGPLTASSPAREAQARHEENTLMVIHSLPSDVPSTPREPSQPLDEDDYQPTAAFGEPEQKVRDREAKCLSLRPQPPPNYNNPSIPDINAILQAMKPPQTQQTQPTSISPELQRTLSMLSQQQPTQPPTAQPPAGGLDLTKFLAVANMQAQAQAQQQQQQYVPAPAAATPNLAALLAQMTQGQQPQPQHQSLPLGLQGNPNPYPGSDSDYSRKHSRTDSNGNDHDGDYNKSKSSSKKKKGNGGAGDSSKPYNYKTMTCVFWQKGQCTKGDMCTYKHEES